MNWTEYIDSYCERVHPGFFAEPLNFFSNLSFILGPILIYRWAYKKGLAFNGSWFIAGILSILVGIGSATFHSLANRWSELFDVGSILAFVAFSLATWITQVAKRSNAWLLAFFAAAIFTTILFLKALEGLPAEGSHGYLGILLSLLFLGYLDKKRGTRYPYIFWASLVFPISLTLRSIDESICPILPVGTHFCWHLLNGLVLSLVILSLLEEKMTLEH